MRPGPSRPVCAVWCPGISPSPAGKAFGRMYGASFRRLDFSAAPSGKRRCAGTAPAPERCNQSYRETGYLPAGPECRPFVRSPRPLGAEPLRKFSPESRTSWPSGGRPRNETGQAVGSGASRPLTSLRSNSLLTGKITGNFQSARRARRKKSAPGNDFRPRLAATSPIGTGNLGAITGKFGALNREVVPDYLLRQTYRARGGSSRMRYVHPSTVPAARHAGQRDAVEGNLLEVRPGTCRRA